MSIDALSLQGVYGAGAAAISPNWFQEVSKSAAASIATGAFSVEDAVGKVQWQNEVLDTYSNEWIVQLTQDSLANIQSVSEVAGLFAPQGFRFEVLGGLGREGQILVRAEGASADAVSAYLGGNSAVAFYEPNAILPVTQVSNDASFSQLWGLRNTGQLIGGQYGTPGADIHAAEAWDIATGSSNVVIAVIDTGVDWRHPDLAANIWTNPYAGQDGFSGDVHGYNFVTNTGDPMDDNGHGTHVAGTIAAVGNNAAGVTGVNWNASIMPLKFLDATGRGSVSNAVRALNYVTMLRTQYGVNVRVTNNSWGGGGYSQALCDAISASGQAGILFVAAAGNAHANNDVTPNYPSNYGLSNVIAVAATDNRDNLASFSNYGLNNVDLAAPGVNILSTRSGGGYQVLSGTSMATPYVAGVAALAWSVDPNASVATIRNAVLGGVDRLASLSGKVATGGRLNARRTLELLGMNVVGSTPSADSAVAARPTQFTVTFSQNYAAASVQASDLTVNGRTANSFVLVNANTIRFIYNVSPVTGNGPQVMRIAEGAIGRSGGGAAVRPWQATFYYDQTALAVTSATPTQGAVLGAPPTSITLVFNEAVAAASVGVNDLLLSSGRVTAATLINARTVCYTVSIPNVEGSVTYTLNAGALSDTYGTPGAAYSGSFSIHDPAVLRCQSTGGPRLILDQNTIVSTITVSDNRTIRDLDVELNIAHTWDADLKVSLVAPNGRSVVLFTRVGGGGDNFIGTILDDEACMSIAAGIAPFAGRFRPTGSLAALDGLKTAGVWRLVISDDSASDTGVLNSWALQFRVNQAPQMSPIANQTLAGTATSLVVPLAATDAEGNPVTYSARIVSSTFVPVRLTVNQRTGALTITRTTNCSGEFDVAVTASDGSDSSVRSFHVSMSNQAASVRAAGQIECAADADLAGAPPAGDPAGLARFTAGLGMAAAAWTAGSGSALGGLYGQSRALFQFSSSDSAIVPLRSPTPNVAISGGLSQFSSDERGLSRFSSDENGTVPLRIAPLGSSAVFTAIDSTALGIELDMAGALWSVTLGRFRTQSRSQDATDEVFSQLDADDATALQVDAALAIGSSGAEIEGQTPS